MEQRKNKNIIEIEPVACCTPMVRTEAEQQQIILAAALLAAVADPTRLAILRILTKSREEVCVCDITASFDLGQPTISHHLKILRDAGLVVGDKRGKWVYYSLVPAKIAELKYQLELLIPDTVLV